MAKINFNVKLTNFDGEPLKDEKKEELTLGSAVKQALLVLDEKASGPDKYESYVLATKVVAGGEVELKSEEITRIKDAIGKYMFPIVVGQAWDLLEGKAPALPAKKE